MKKEAKWITSPKDPGKASYTYRKDFCIGKTVKQATLCVSSLGIYVPYMNGERVGKMCWLRGGPAMMSEYNTKSME